MYICVLFLVHCGTLRGPVYGTINKSQGTEHRHCSRVSTKNSYEFRINANSNEDSSKLLLTSRSIFFFSIFYVSRKRVLEKPSTMKSLDVHTPHLVIVNYAYRLTESSLDRKRDTNKELSYNIIHPVFERDILQSRNFFFIPYFSFTDVILSMTKVQDIGSINAVSRFQLTWRHS